jgi:hydroxymethylpyrimidine kinase/phosphomethylpyrimidine kinase
MQHPAIALTIAGSDSSGGAGIQADLKTFAALGVYGASVITALTAQNTQAVTAIHDVPADFIAAQIDAVFSDLDVGAVKIGMLSQAASIETVAIGLDRHHANNIVLDPVMVASSGDRCCCRAVSRAFSARARHYAEPAGSCCAARHRAGARRARDGAPSARTARPWRTQCVDQGRPRRRR